MSPNYFMLECTCPPFMKRSVIQTFPDLPNISWLKGEKISVDVPVPLIFELDPSRSSSLHPMYYGTYLLMEKPLIAKLQEAGVNCLDCYEAVIVYPRGKKKEFTTHMAVNITKKVNKVDFKKSIITSDPNDPIRALDFFEGVTLDDKKEPQGLMFRLAESLNAIVIHESVKNVLQRGNFPGLLFIEPEKWAG